MKGWTRTCQYLSSVQPDNTIKEDLFKKNIMGKNKQVACKICFHFMRSNNVKKHMKVHQKYSQTNKTPQSAEDICRDLVLEIVDKVVAPVEESSGIGSNVSYQNTLFFYKIH